VNLASIIEEHPADSVALIDDSERITFGQLRARAAATRRGLGAEGVVPGDRVALLLPTSADFVVAYLGIIGAGAIAVPLNPQSPLPEIESEIAQVRPALVLVDPGRPEPGADASLVSSRSVPLSDLESSRGETPPLFDPPDNHPAIFLFTSGTAGAPKAAVLTHGNLLANIEQVELRVGLAVTAEDVGVLVVPPFHILGLNAVLGVQLYAGGPLVLVERFDAASLLHTIRDESVTVLAGVPQLFASLLAVPDAAGDELATIRLACSGAAPLGSDVATAFEARFGVRIWQGYGLTEASPTVTFPDLARPWRPESVGTPLPGVEVRVVDVDGDDVELGDPGEILVRGPNVFAGYFENERASAAAVDVAGWLHTGDVAVMDEDGCLTIVDRSKDLIIVSGFNVFPAEVEHVLLQHEGVAEAAVVGVPDPASGEAVKAFVVPAGESGAELEEAEIVEFCSRRLARYKCPASVVVVGEIPRSLGGKVLRRAIG
jgi:long-chain acyl-CoA synthetase